MNLSRFPLFFPEKRTFFLEGADIFDFGLGLTSDLDVLPFFSRRIGLLAGQQEAQARKLSESAEAALADLRDVKAFWK